MRHAFHALVRKGKVAGCHKLQTAPLPPPPGPGAWVGSGVGVGIGVGAGARLVSGTSPHDEATSAPLAGMHGSRLSITEGHWAEAAPVLPVLQPGRSLMQGISSWQPLTLTRGACWALADCKSSEMVACAADDTVDK